MLSRASFIVQNHNADFISIQDSLAQAVAEEMQKVYKTELGPQPVPLTVPREQKMIDEEDVSLVCFIYLLSFTLICVHRCILLMHCTLKKKNY